MKCRNCGKRSGKHFYCEVCEEENTGYLKRRISNAKGYRDDSEHKKVSVPRTPEPPKIKPLKTQKIKLKNIIQ